MKLLRSDIYENLMMALSTLRANKLRSILTVIGVVIGVVVVMLISSIISGIDLAVKKEVEQFGTRSIFINKFDNGPRTHDLSREERMRAPLTFEDSVAISQLPAVEAAVPIHVLSTNPFSGEAIAVSRAGKTSSSVRIAGTTPDYERAGGTVANLSEGRYFNNFENETRQQVCVIGSSVADNFFPYGSPIGQTIEVGGREFRVVGVLMKREQFGGGDGGNDLNNLVHIPFDLARQLNPDTEGLQIRALARVGMLELAKQQIEDILRVRRRVPFDQPNNFGLNTADSIVETFHSIIAGVAIAMVAISSVGLMVGGIGVMNIMLVSVTERTREIGTRKAIGARRSDILWQFLIEAMTLTGLGGLLGLLIGWSLTLLVGLFLPSYVPLWAPAVGFFASVGIGLIFGLWPAWKAARLDPIEALRYE